MKLFIGILLCVSLVVIAFHAGCIDDSNTVMISYFSAESSYIAPGENTTIQWAVIGASSVRIDPLIGHVGLVGNRSIALEQTTQFTLTAEYENASVTRNITVTVEDREDSDSVIIDTEGFQNAKQDPYDIMSANISEDVLQVTVSYSGGCKNHSFNLYSLEGFMESEPVQARLVLAHDAHDDMCEAYITETLLFDISPLKEKWQQEYQQDSGTIICILENYSRSLQYMFGADEFSFLNVRIQTDKEVYEDNESVKVSVLVENLKSEDVFLEFPSSKIADFICRNNEDDVVYQWSDGKMFLTVITQITVPANSTIELFNASWNQIDDQGELVDDGVYMVQGLLPGFYYQDDMIDYSKTPGPILYSDPVQIMLI